jgi:mRNA interferase RelE/StbE
VIPQAATGVKWSVPVQQRKPATLMDYDIYYLDDARASLKRLSPEVARRIVNKIGRMRHGLAGDVKRLKAYVPNYRLRVGDWRVLFEVEGGDIIIHEIKHRSEAYDG